MPKIVLQNYQILNSNKNDNIILKKITVKNINNKWLLHLYIKNNYDFLILFLIKIYIL